MLESGSILRGGVGSGKSRTSLAYFFAKVCFAGEIERNKPSSEGGKLVFSKMKQPTDLYIITTARKRDSLEWDGECAIFLVSKRNVENLGGINVVIDSWNNISKYKRVEGAFFIFDEQRLVGSGSWVKSFLNISKKNKWIVLTATPGDTWSDYIPIFVANGYYKNKTEFLDRHAVYNRFSKFPKIDRYLETERLRRIQKKILVEMPYESHAVRNRIQKTSSHDKEAMRTLLKKRWNIYEERPIKNISELCYNMRKVSNSDPSRYRIVADIVRESKKVIIFYNFDYELEILRKLSKDLDMETAEWNGHVHQRIPKGERWVYLVQYAAGAEAWNCTETDTMIFYSPNYSYKTMMQAEGRIDRLNTPYDNLYYYYIQGTSNIDLAIKKALSRKKKFNESSYASSI